ncbi:MAG: two-component system, OmpR family, phosphate regulon response regulator OmpR [Acetobacteraceae bacterium]|jgi:two-component system phosphate regulon response regulator OmpR|nr:two-component system, OmpR family, phosphate regulon response regulator OmpR [Acetobacteraceae bacterium]
MPNSAISSGGTVNDCHILVVEDDPRLRERLARYLTGEGFRVTAAADAADARAKLRVIDPDLMVLDVMMPGEDGLELTQSLRQVQNHAVPILLLTARSAPEDRIAGFEAGADDYLGKPFEPRELVLRIRALLRRAPPPIAPEVPAGPVRIGDAEFDVERGELRDGTGPIRLTGGEAALLTALARRPHEVLSREDIAEALGMDESGERAIDVQVVRLRRKIEADPREPRFLHTVRGRGYILKPGA